MIKKQLIMEKSLELFAKQGFEATSVQQITEYCGISKGAFYLSFKSKDELILALIDHFLMQFTTDIDYVVKNTKDDDQLFLEFYYTTFNSFLEHSNFGKVLMKEQSQSFNKELLIKMQSYDKLYERSIITMIERLYGDDIEHIKYDLMYCIKGFVSTYSHLFLFQNVSLDLDLLSQSLVEKTHILAKHTTIPFISAKLVNMDRLPIEDSITKEHILEIMDQKINEIEESIEKESLVLLKEHLIKPNLSPAIVKGLLENIRNHPHCKWVSYLLRDYFGY